MAVHSLHDRSSPRPVIFAGAGLMILSLVLAAYGSWTQGPLALKRAGGTVMERALIFSDRADGAILVHEAGDLERHVAVLEGPQGFIRGVLRSFARDRRALGRSGDTPFILALHDDGSLSITDPVTDQTVFLSAFGKDNVSAFAAVMMEGQS